MQNAQYTQFQDGMKFSASHLQTRCKGWGDTCAIYHSNN